MPARENPGHHDPLHGERVEFPSRRGNMLVGDLHRSSPRCGPTLVLCHGMESTRSGTKQAAIVERFVPEGFSVLRFDFSYVGESEGRFEDLTISGEVADALGALDFLAEFEPSACVLVGSSLGGAVALLAAASAPAAVTGVMTIAAVADATLFTAGMSPQEIDRWRRSGRRAWGEGVMNASLLEDVESLDITGAVARLDMPLLVAHGDSDDVVPPRHAQLIAEAARGPVQLEIFPGVRHRFEEPGALGRLLDVMGTWLQRVARA